MGYIYVCIYLRINIKTFITNTIFRLLVTSGKEEKRGITLGRGR